jgi:WD40 repeat protein
MLYAFVLSFVSLSVYSSIQHAEARVKPDVVLRLKAPIRSLLHNPLRGEIVCATGVGLTAISIRSKNITWSTDYETHAYEPVAICSNSKEMAAIGKDGVTLWDLATYERRGFINSNVEYHYCYYTNGGTLLVGRSFHRALLLDRKQPDAAVIQNFPPGYAGAYVSPNGAVAFLRSSVLDSRAGPPGRVVIYDVGFANARKDLFVPHCKYEISCLGAAHDGRLLFVGDEGGNSVLMDTKTYKMTKLPAAKHCVDRAAFSSDAGLLAYGDHWGNVLVWDIKNAQIVDQINYHNESILGLIIVGDRDACLIATGDRKGKVALWKRHFRHAGPRP